MFKSNAFVIIISLILIAALVTAVVLISLTIRKEKFTKPFTKPCVIDSLMSSCLCSNVPCKSGVPPAVFSAYTTPLLPVLKKTAPGSTYPSKGPTPVPDTPYATKGPGVVTEFTMEKLPADLWAWLTFNDYFFVPIRITKKTFTVSELVYDALCGSINALNVSFPYCIIALHLSSPPTDTGAVTSKLYSADKSTQTMLADYPALMKVNIK